MKEWNIFKRGVECFIGNCELIEIFPSPKDDGFDIVASRLEKRVKDLFDTGCYYNQDKTLGQYIMLARHEISNKLVNVNTRELTILRVKKDFDQMLYGLKEISDKWGLNLAKHKGRFGHSYFPYIQEIYNFYDWFLIEAGLMHRWSQSQLTYIEPLTQKEMKSPQEIEMRKKRVKMAVASIKPDNIDEVYQKNFNRYLYLQSDKVEVNGKLVNDKFKRMLLLFPNEKGEPNIKSATADGKIDGFPITEIDFIEHELNFLSTEDQDLATKKRVQTYIDYLNKKANTLLDKPLPVNTNTTQSPTLPQSPFLSDIAFKYFAFLNEQLNVKGKKRWSYIFNELKDSKYYQGSERVFFRFISENFEKVATRVQSSANDPEIISVLNKLRDQFNKSGK